VNKSAYFLLVLGLGSALILVCFLMPEQFTEGLRKEAMELLGPVLRTADKPVTFFSRMNGKLKTLDEAQREVTRLDQEVADLTVQNQVLTDKATENARLREMLGFRAASPYRLRACRVVSREPSSWWDTVQVNVGWADDPDLAKDQPVVSPRGVVGKTGTVSRYVTDVILMVNQNCSISANVEGTHDQGIVKGQGNFEEGKPRVMVDYLPKNSLVAPGQFVITSGLGPNFPAGLRLGTVIEVPPLNNEYPTFGLYREAVIEPTADLNQLDELFVVLGAKEKTDKSDEKPDTESNPAPETNSQPETNAQPVTITQPITNSASQTAVPVETDTIPKPIPAPSNP
jgi:rod shape-determining protein MreC